ncbi:uncharacterized protein N7483_012068 [Penicillium malachiteum]|uniref:uncharacterized protein n=1 Tax=Penicillium malachiteum TaxID=1324776 RepID=UPI00254703E4|nr:uncharacterized protein N7483_012068 [Penicillium malachiteum]KAJ5714887.1 hypothetical protein N7483_012068 [Penicillium malachiteum]
MRSFAILPVLSLLVSSATAANWGLDFYSSKSCIDAHGLMSYGDSVSDGCQNIESEKLIHAVQGDGLGTTWHAKIYSGADCTGSEHTLTGSKCNDCQNLFGDGTTDTILSWNVSLIPMFEIPVLLY